LGHPDLLFVVGYH